MFGVGFSEIIVIGIIALVFVGPKKLPDLARQAGRLFVQFRRMTGDVRSTVDDFIRKAEEEIRQEERQALLKILGAEPGTAQPSLAAMEHGHSTDGAHHGHHDPHHSDPHHHDPHHLPEGHAIDTTATQVPPADGQADHGSGHASNQESQSSQAHDTQGGQTTTSGTAGKT